MKNGNFDKNNYREAGRGKRPAGKKSGPRGTSGQTGKEYFRPEQKANSGKKNYGQQGEAKKFNKRDFGQYEEIISPENRPGAEDMHENMLEGRNPVREAIRAGRDIERILVSEAALEGSSRDIVKLARDKGILVHQTDKAKLDKLSQTGVHQGIIAFAAAKNYCEIEDILTYAREKGEDPFIIVLDGITDPQNLGSILRSAECAGVHGVIIPKRRAVGLTPVVAKASAGAVEYMRVAKVNNIPQTIERLKKEGLWIFGAHPEGESYVKTNLTGPLAIVIGAEGEGLSQLTRTRCDRLIALPLKGQIESLNAAVSAAVIMYEALRQRS